MITTTIDPKIVQLFAKQNPFQGKRYCLGYVFFQAPFYYAADGRVAIQLVDFAGEHELDNGEKELRFPDMSKLGWNVSRQDSLRDWPARTRATNTNRAGTAIVCGKCQNRGVFGKNAKPCDCLDGCKVCKWRKWRGRSCSDCEGFGHQYQIVGSHHIGARYDYLVRLLPNPMYVKSRSNTPLKISFDGGQAILMGLSK